MFKTNRRFIAGAVCPKCSEMDKLVMYRIACDYKDVMKSEEEMAEDAAQAAQITTRVTPEGKPLRDDGEQAIKIFDAMPPSKTKH